MVIRTFRQPEASEPIDTQRPIWSSASFVQDSMPIDRDYFSLTLSSGYGKSDDMRRHLMVFCTSSFGDPKSDDMRRQCMVIRTLTIQRQSSLITCGDTSRLFAPLSSRDGESDDMQRQHMVISTLAIQRQSSLIACRDTSWLSAPRHLETPSLMTCGDKIWSSAPFLSRDNRVQ